MPQKQVVSNYERQLEEKEELLKALQEQVRGYLGIQYVRVSSVLPPFRAPLSCSTVHLLYLNQNLNPTLELISHEPYKMHGGAR
jgi:hypothetical protein